MIDKVQKIRNEVEKLKSNLMYGACSSQVAMETRCKEEAYNEVLSIMDSMQEEPKECMYSKDNYTAEDRKVLCEGCEEECKFNKKEETVSEDLEKAIDTYLATYWGGEQEKQDWPYLKKMAIHFANWQKEEDNELTWEVISTIRQIMFDYNRQIRNEMTILNDEEYCEEVLRRYKENIY